MSTFSAAPPEWFAEKGLTPPKNCPDCRRWIKAQTDSAYRCRDCGWGIRQSAKAKITHHKRKGVYAAPEQCNRCKEGVESLEGLEDETPQPRELRKTKVEALVVASYDKLSEYRREHYGKHIPEHPYSEVGMLNKKGEPVSRTSLVGPGASSVELYFAASEVAGRIDDTYQYKSGDNVIKAIIVDGTHVEVTVFRPLGDGTYELVTTYDEVPITVAKAKIASREWK